MQNKKPTLIQILNIRLADFAMKAGFTVALIFGVVVAATFFYQQARHQRALLHSIQNNMALLSQNSDSREIERVLASFLEAVPGGEVTVIRDGQIQVSLPDTSKMFTPFVPEKTISLLGITVSKDSKIYSSVPLQEVNSHASFGEMILKTPMTEALWSALVALFASFSTIWLLLFAWRRRSRQILAKALDPLHSLYRDIEQIGQGAAPQKHPEEFSIKELADISQVIQKQYADVVRLTEAAAKAEGERRAKEGVRSLMHDLLNPYTAMSNLIQGRILYPEDGDIKDELAATWPVLNGQIKALLKAARHMEVEAPNKILHDLVDTVSEGARIGAVKNPKALKLSIGAEVKAIHDPALLSRAIANLVRNSVEEGASQIDVWCDENPLSIHVKDNGPGIPQEKVALLFEGRMKSQKPDGSGIGFPTALRLVQSHNGKITLESDDNAKGAHFRIDLSQLERSI